MSLLDEQDDILISSATEKNTEEQNAAEETAESETAFEAEKSKAVKEPISVSPTDRVLISERASLRKPKKRKNVSTVAFISVLSAFVVIFTVLLCTYQWWGRGGNGIFSNGDGAVSEFTNSELQQQIVESRKGYVGVAPSYSITEVPINQEPLSIVNAVKKARASVVTVKVYARDKNNVQSVVSVGSGIVMTENGFVLTNEHVVYNKAYDASKIEVEVITLDGYSYDGFIMGLDGNTDLAVVKVDAHDLTPAEFADSDSLEVGESILVIGSPGGLDYAGSVTQGIISGLNRQPSGSNTTLPLIQVDAAINPGNSGGALVNLYGQVVGINSSKLVSTSFEGMGFSIPTKQAKKIIDVLIRVGYIEGRPRLGVSVAPVSADLRSKYHLPEGLYIVKIDKESNLYGTRVAEGDILTAIDNRKISSTQELYDYLDLCKPGQEVTLHMYYVGDAQADDEEYTVKVKLLESQ